MKKFLSILMAVLMLAVACTAALAEDTSVTPEPEGGKKFNSSWALMGGLVEINYEEEGYRVMIDMRNYEDMNGTIWEYNCYYHEDEDALVSVSAMKHSYEIEPETFSLIHGDNEYEGLDEEGQETVFTINEAGMLIWKDGRENIGADLEFQDIGPFNLAQYANADKSIWAEFEWKGLDEETFWYRGLLNLGGEETQLEYNLQCTYDPATRKLSGEGNSVTWVPNDQGGYDPTDEDQPCSATFTLTEDGKLIYEEGNVEMEYQLDPIVDSQG